MKYFVIHKNFKIFYQLNKMRGNKIYFKIRYRYLVKNGSIKKIENGGNIIFSELS